MRLRLSRFAVVGSAATVLDVVLAVALTRAGWPAALADVVALGSAAAVAYVLHRLITLRDDPFARWIHQPAMFLLVVVLAGAVDVALFTVMGADVGAKVVAVLAAAIVRGLSYRMLLFRVIRSEQDQPLSQALPDGDFRLSVVVPAYRERDRIGATIRQIRTDLKPLEGGLEIVVVDDGSGDGTADAARSAGADLVLSLPENSGKGAAVRAGMLAASGQIRAFTDADLAYAPAQLLDFVDRIEEGFDMAVGNRRHVATRTLVRAGRMREAGGRLINVATHALLLGQYRDTQCGLKAFRADAAFELFGRARIDRFAFDVELFHLAERLRLTLAEVPVSVENSERSTVHIARDGLRLLGDIARIRRLGRSGAYDRVRAGEFSG